VIEFYDRGGRPNPNLSGEIQPLRLTLRGKEGLVAFLRALTGNSSARSNFRTSNF
jgi:hypothetical protein